MLLVIHDVASTTLLGFSFDPDDPDYVLTLKDEYSATVNVFLHFTVLGVIALATGRPFLFPSLGRRRT